MEEKSTKEESSIFDEESSEDVTAESESEEETTTEAEKVTTQEITTPEAVTVPEIETTTAETEIPANPAAGGTAGTISISPGMTSEAVSSLLASSGIISDANDFNDYLTSTGYATTIHVGTFDIPAASDYASIAQIIAGR